MTTTTDYIEMMNAQALQAMKLQANSPLGSILSMYENSTFDEAWSRVWEASRVDMARCRDMDAAKEYVEELIVRPFLPLWNKQPESQKANLLSDLKDYPYGGATFISAISKILQTA